MTSPLRVLIVVNKTWECEPIVSVLTHRDARPAVLDRFRRVYDPLGPHERKGEEPRYRATAPPRPRLAWSIGGDAFELWCIEDWMTTAREIDLPCKGKTLVELGSSSSWEKLTGALPAIGKCAFGGARPSLVIAVGTAGIPADHTLNGCVTIGTRCYVQDPWADAPKKEVDEQVARWGPLITDEISELTKGVILSPGLSPALFTTISMESRFSAEARFLSAPINPAHPPRILAGHGYAALSTININDYDDYVWADEETMRKFEQAVKQREIGSMETTHALIRIHFRDTPFMFVSGITDRVPMFNAEVTPRKYTQNFVGAHNAGVALAHMLPELTRLHGADGLLT